MNAILSLFLFLMPLQATSPEEMYKDYITPEVQAVLDEADRIAEESREAEESARNKKTLALVFSLAVGLIPVVHIGLKILKGKTWEANPSGTLASLGIALVGGAALFAINFGVLMLKIKMGDAFNTTLAFLLVVGYMDILKRLVIPNQDYWVGLKVVPIVMAAEIMMGIYFNLSFWYKITDRTIWGAVFSGIGCVVLIAVNIIFVPVYGFMACAWAGLIGYSVAMLTSYFVGQKYYPINYPLKDIALYLLIAFAIFEVMNKLSAWAVAISLAANTLLIILFVVYIVWRDFPLSNLPVVGKYFKKPERKIN